MKLKNKSAKNKTRITKLEHKDLKKKKKRIRNRNYKKE
jgi:hypothetical protein